METAKRLVMSFKSTLGRVVSISVDDRREDITYTTEFDLVV